MFFRKINLNELIKFNIVLKVIKIMDKVVFKFLLLLFLFNMINVINGGINIVKFNKL